MAQSRNPIPPMPVRMILPDTIYTPEGFAVWVYEVEGEPAFEVRFTCAEKEIQMAVTPMHMDGGDAETTYITAA